jgi:hypothetical protein
MFYDILTFTPWIDNRGRLKAKLHYKRDDFNFSLSSSNISAAPAYGVYISQLLHYSRACAEYIDFLERAQMLRQKLLQRSKVGPKSWSDRYKKS